MTEPAQSRLLTHAMAWSEDQALNRVRKNLVELVNEPTNIWAGRWAFGLYQRPHPKPELMTPRVIGICTLTESAALTGAMILQLPKALRLYGQTCKLEMIPICAEPEILEESVPGVLLRVLSYGNFDVPTTTALASSDLPVEGLVFSTNLTHPPKGWPV